MVSRSAQTSKLRISEMEVVPVACPDPPLLNHHGVHESTFLRAIVRLRTADGLEGLGEGPGGSLYVQQLNAARSYVIDADPYQLTALHSLVGYTNPRVFSAIETACLDLIGKATGRPVSDLLGGAVRRHVPFCAYLFYKEEGDDDWGPALTPEQIVGQAERFHERYGMTVFKLKGGVLEPFEEVHTLRLLRERFGPRAGLRIDPNTAWSVETSIRVAEAAQDLDLEYLEDPTAGIDGMAAVARHTHIPLATNMCVTSFDDIAIAYRERAVQVILGDHHGWGGMLAFRNLGMVCKTLKLGLSQHSNNHLGISFAAMIHSAAAIPNLLYHSDTHYPWNPFDIVNEVEHFRFTNGRVTVSDAPGLGVSINEEKLEEAADAYRNRGANLARDDIAAMRERNPDYLPLLPKW